ncbi:hemin-degrading factor [Tropicimonas sp.]|uniref:hemin-degrading factor n=1 Tax=Tropicimonas sp. TaxID=2067044 RepID=UPI003A854C64
MAADGALRIDASPDRLIPMIAGLGAVTAVTRNRSCVIEKTGIYDNFHPGQHAAMVLTPEIDLRIFPRHWVTAFAVGQEAPPDDVRGIRVFDAAGDPVHEVFTGPETDAAHWQRLVDTLRTAEQSDNLPVSPRKPVERPRVNAAKAGELRAQWEKLTDTHQFLRLTSKLGMNRLGAYRIAGEPFVRRLSPSAVGQALDAVAERALEVMIFVGNMGCIEIHGGPIAQIDRSDRWWKAQSDGFAMHLLADRISEVWAVDKPTRRGAAVSLEAFDDEGALVFQIFARRTERRDFRHGWDALVAGLQSHEGVRG